MKIRVILSTSALQLVNSKAAIAFLNNNKFNQDFKTYVIIIHPLLNKRSKKIISKYSIKFNFEIIDLSYFFSQINEKEKSYQNYLIKLFFFKFKNLIKNYQFNNYHRPKIIKKISEIFNQEFKNVDEVFVRSNYKKLDLAYYEALGKNFKTYLIEDGQYDFKHSKFHHINIFLHSLKSKFFNNLYDYILFFISLFTTFNFKDSINKNLAPRINYQLKFNNFNNYKSINISKYTKEIFKKLVNAKEKDIAHKIIIIGSVFKYKALNINDEIKIYNLLIEKIKKNYLIKNTDILYIPHPRATNLDIKLKKIDCLILNDNTSLIEEFFIKMNIKAVYSLGSSSLIYASLIFNIPSFFIDVTKIKNNFKYPYPGNLTNEFQMYKNYRIKKIEI